MAAAEREQALGRYALALAYLPDENAALDLLRNSRDEADLRRRLAAWCAQAGIPMPPSDPPLPVLTADQAEQALHVVDVARKRRRLLPAVWAGVAALCLLLFVGSKWWERAHYGAFADGQLYLPAATLRSPVTTVKLAKFGGQSPYTDTVLIVHPPDEPIRAFSGHDLFGNHCIIPWVPEEALFHEPCRGTMFNLQGKLMGGPGPLGMGEFPLRVAGSAIIVDLTRAPLPTEDRDPASSGYSGEVFRKRLPHD